MANKEKIDIKTIKLIIWDLDDTFWKGTFSEGGATPIDANIQFLKDSTDCGIVNSICSRNEAELTIKHLKELNVWDYFIFASINWDNKSQRLRNQIDQMALRPQNVLFLDDNQFNLQEAKHYLPELQVGTPDVLEDLARQLELLPKKDTAHKRLKQYKILEEKAEEQSHYDSNEEFLFASKIRVTISHDCENEIARIHELILRSNQLNYTKKRISEEELRTLLHDKTYECGYVRVTDRFGDYGIVGFYALKDDCLEHFVFSCRTMGQMIEQWVYAQLGFPHVDVVGEVRTILNNHDVPAWINISDENNVVDSNQIKKKQDYKILLKGPCDLSHSMSYIKDEGQMDAELTYVLQNGQVIDAYNHSVHILGLKYSDEEKEQIATDCSFVDKAMLYDGKFFSGEYDIIFLSILIEALFGIYHKRGTDIEVAYSHKSTPITAPKNWDSFLGKNYDGNVYTKEYLEEFSRKYEFVGGTTPERYKAFLQKAIEWLPKKTTLCIILGSTFKRVGFEKQAEDHKRLNDTVIELAKTEPRLRYINIDEIITDDNGFVDNTISHYTARVYYEIAMRMQSLIEEKTGIKTDSYSHKYVHLDRILLKIRNSVIKIAPEGSRLFKILRPVYLKLARKKNTLVDR